MWYYSTSSSSSSSSSSLNTYFGSYLTLFWEDLTECVSSLYSWGFTWEWWSCLWDSWFFFVHAYLFFRDFCHFCSASGRSLTSNNLSFSTSVFLSKRYHLRPEQVRGIPMFFFLGIQSRLKFRGHRCDIIQPFPPFILQSLNTYIGSMFIVIVVY